MKIMLPCNMDPKSIGIENGDGNWNMDELKRHIEGCPACATFIVVVWKEIFDGMDLTVAILPEG